MSMKLGVQEGVGIRAWPRTGRVLQRKAGCPWIWGNCLCKSASLWVTGFHGN